MDIRLRVLNLIAKYRTKNPFKLANSLGIVVKFVDLGEVRGLFKKILKKKYIFINSKLSEFDQTLVCAHELGHAVLHSSSEYQFLIDNTKILSYLLFPNGLDIEIECIETETNIWMFGEMKRLREF